MNKSHLFSKRTYIQQFQKIKEVSESENKYLQTLNNNIYYTVYSQLESTTRYNAHKQSYICRQLFGKSLINEKEKFH